MHSAKKILILTLLAIISVTAFAKPPHAKSHNKNIFAITPLPQIKANGPPNHDKAWGRKYDRQNMSKEERRALKDAAKNKNQEPDIIDHVKALGRQLLQ